MPRPRLRRRRPRRRRRALPFAGARFAQELAAVEARRPLRRPLHLLGDFVRRERGSRHHRRRVVVVVRLRLRGLLALAVRLAVVGGVGVVVLGHALVLAPRCRLRLHHAMPARAAVPIALAVVHDPRPPGRQLALRGSRRRRLRQLLELRRRDARLRRRLRRRRRAAEAPSSVGEPRRRRRPSATAARGARRCTSSSRAPRR